jgi:outer membrane protein assembly factor BamB
VLVDFRSLPDTQDEFVGVAVDPARGEFYWSDRVTNTIWRARLDAGETITPDNIDRLATPVVQYRRGMTIDLWLDTQTHTLYWSDRGEDKPARTLPAGFIASVQLDDPNRTIHYLARGLVKDPIGISGDAGSGTLYFSTQNDARIYRLPLSGQAKPEALYQQGVMAAGVTLVDWSQ